jgi:cyclopropane fatty-acyl-phospholipid synthase-like methyltransferase
MQADDAEPCCVTYWLNRLQNLPSYLPQLFVTLNPADTQLPAEHLILAEFNYAHPQYNPKSVAAQRQLHALQGVQNTWFCGAYLGYGFHEDAITSGLRVAAAITGQIPTWWKVPMYKPPTIRGMGCETLTASEPAAWATLNSAGATVLRSSGGPYWYDNSGNGGPVGRVTAYVKSLHPPSHSPTSAAVAYPEDVMATFQALQGRQEVEAADADDDTASSLSFDNASRLYSATTDLSIVSLNELSSRSLGISYRRFSAPNSLSTQIPPLPTVVGSASLVKHMAEGMGGYSVHPPSLYLPELHSSTLHWIWDLITRKAYHMMAAPVVSYLRQSIVLGCVMLRFPDGFEVWIGSPSAPAAQRAKICVHSWRFFLRLAAEADLGLARSFMAGEWSSDDLTALFTIFIHNRDSKSLSATSLWTSVLGTGLNYLSFTMLLDNSLSGSRKNIHAHYDLSNDLFASFLDPTTMMYSCGFFDTKRRAVYRQALPDSNTASLLPASLAAPNVFSSASGSLTELVFEGTLADAQIRKLDHLIARAEVQQSDSVLDLGFGWGGLAIRLAETVGCRVHGITLSTEQFQLASLRVKERNLGHLITFEIADYRDFAIDHAGAFNKIISVEMVEAVGHSYFDTYLACLDRMLAPNGVIVLQAITIPDSRYNSYIRSTDFINSVVFPGGSLPCLSRITAAMAKTTLLLTSVDEFGIHYAETLRRWRANFNMVTDSVIPALGFDQQFIRTWNYYFCYCEAGFQSSTLGLQVWTMSRPGCTSSFTATPSGKLASCVGPAVSPSVTYPDCAF